MQDVRTITLHGDTIPLVVRKSKKARYIRLSLSGSGILIGTLPVRVNEAFLHTFIQEKSAWIVEKRKEMMQQGDQKEPLDPFSLQYKVLKKEALALVTEKLRYFNSFVHFPLKGISIRNQKTVWGSCSSRNILQFNYRIALIPSELQDYVVVHELCHLRHMNHSSAFWNEVEQLLPAYKTYREALKGYELAVK